MSERLLLSLWADVPGTGIISGKTGLNKDLHCAPACEEYRVVE